MKGPGSSRKSDAPREPTAPDADRRAVGTEGARARTSTRNPVLHLLLFGVAFLIENEWVWTKFGRFLAWLVHAASAKRSRSASQSTTPTRSTGPESAEGAREYSGGSCDPGIE